MRVLVACEYSGTVRDAFRALGHDAMSCDLLPTEVSGPHYQGDVRDVLGDGWDLMVAHPPCTYLSYAANHVWEQPGRAEKRIEALWFFMQFVNAPIPRICIENPVGLPNSVYRKPDQIIEPMYFGGPFLKRTCLWLKGLRQLVHSPCETLFDCATHTERPRPAYVSSSGKNIHWTEANSGGHARSRSFPGIARAMAEQWGGNALEVAA